MKFWAAQRRSLGQYLVGQDGALKRKSDGSKVPTVHLQNLFFSSQSGLRKRLSAHGVLGYRARAAFTRFCISLSLLLKSSKHKGGVYSGSCPQAGILRDRLLDNPRLVKYHGVVIRELDFVTAGR